MKLRTTIFDLVHCKIYKTECATRDHTGWSLHCLHDESLDTASSKSKSKDPDKTKEIHMLISVRIVFYFLAVWDDTVFFD